MALHQEKGLYAGSLLKAETIEFSGGSAQAAECEKKGEGRMTPKHLA